MQEVSFPLSVRVVLMSNVGTYANRRYGELHVVDGKAPHIDFIRKAQDMDCMRDNRSGHN